MIAGALAFVRSGWVSYGVAEALGSYGRVWSRTSATLSGTTPYSYSLVFHATAIMPSGNYPYYHRYHGLPLRCLYPGSA